jgi:hypothetical protein
MRYDFTNLLFLYITSWKKYDPHSYSTNIHSALVFGNICLHSHICFKNVKMGMRMALSDLFPCLLPDHFTNNHMQRQFSRNTTNDSFNSKFEKLKKIKYKSKYNKKEEGFELNHREFPLLLAWIDMLKLDRENRSSRAKFRVRSWRGMTRMDLLVKVSTMLTF